MGILKIRRVIVVIGVWIIVRIVKNSRVVCCVEMGIIWMMEFVFRVVLVEPGKMLMEKLVKTVKTDVWTVFPILNAQIVTLDMF